MKIELQIILLTLLLSGCGAFSYIENSSAANQQNAISNNNSNGLMLDYGSLNIPQEFLNPSTFKICFFSDDETYAYTKENPVMVGVSKDGQLNDHKFFNALTGPNGEYVKFQHLGKCCKFRSNNGLYGNQGTLDMYEISFGRQESNFGEEERLIVYLNMYDSDVLKVPVGMALKTFDKGNFGY